MTNTTAPTNITARMLQDKGACAEQVEKFKVEWPRGGPVTRENLERAREIGLNLSWFAKTFLPATARAEYERVRAPARAEYERVRATALIDALLKHFYGEK